MSYESSYQRPSLYTYVDEVEVAKLLADVPPGSEPLVYHEVEPVRRTGPIVTLAGLTLGLLGGIVLGYMLHMAVHGV
jgi:hypothetical protein